MKTIKNLVLSLALVAGIWSSSAINNRSEAAITCFLSGGFTCALGATLGAVAVSGLTNMAFHSAGKTYSVNDEIFFETLGWMGIVSFGALALLGDDNMEAMTDGIIRAGGKYGVELDVETAMDLASNVEVKKAITEGKELVEFSINEEVIRDTMELGGYSISEANQMVKLFK